MFKNRISAATERRRGNRSSQKKTRSWRGEGRVYVLDCMVVTFPTCHAERSPLKAVAPLNTAPQQQRDKEKSKDKNRLKKKISAKTIKKGKRDSLK